MVQSADSTTFKKLSLAPAMVLDLSLDQRYSGIRYCGQRYCGKGIVDNRTNKGIVGNCRNKDICGKNYSDTTSRNTEIEGKIIKFLTVFRIPNAVKVSP